MTRKELNAVRKPRSGLLARVLPEQDGKEFAEIWIGLTIRKGALLNVKSVIDAFRAYLIKERGERGQ